MTRGRAILIAVVVLAAMVISAALIKVPLPHIQLPAEWIPGSPVIHMPFGGDFYITNTVIAILITDLLLLVLALATSSNMKKVPSGLQNVFEMLIEFWENTSLQMIGEERTKQWLPLVLTIFLLIMASNWAELVPGYDTVGMLCVEEACSPGAAGHEVDLGAGTAYAQEEAAGHDEGAAEAVGRHESGAVSGEDEVTAAGALAEAQDDHGGEHTLFWVESEVGPFGLATRRAEEGDDPARLRGFVPFLRVAASDLNFTLALALISLVAIQIVGLKALGLHYVNKFVAVGWIPDFIRGKEGSSRVGLLAGGLLAVFVGIIELISELSRIISFSFRLFGNMFAGQILLFVIPFLIPFLTVVPIYGLELFVGMIQAFVFAILTLAFMSTAVISHGDH
ncbi:MAG: F0F1 ATP synthase subunit A [Anaerolineae bacterium]